MRRVLLSAIFCLSATPALTQAPPSQSEALDLLRQVAKRYADAKTYSITAIEEMTQTGEYQRIWSKTVFAATEAPGGRFNFEAHGNAGGAIRISDGKTTWKYHAQENHYTATPAEASSPKGVVPIAEIALLNAQYLRSNLAGLAGKLRSASASASEPVVVDGKSVQCAVVHVRDTDRTHPDPNASTETTIWIDEQKHAVVKIEERREVQHINVPHGLPLSQVTTTIYPRTELDGTIPDSAFTFVPPPGAILLANFPDPMDGYGLPSMSGDTIPSLKLKSADGKIVSIESFRGKPVLIDFWATWCAPCVAAMPKMAEIYKEGKDKGLTLLSVDQDEDAAKAAAFLAKNGHAWPNFHDGDGAIAKLMGSSPIPRVVLVDAKGQIAYDGTGGDESRVRTHLAQHGTELSALAPKPKTPPCDVAAQSH